MKKINYLLLAFTFLLATNIIAQPVITVPDASQKASVSQTIGITDITIAYNGPGVKGRTIWGGIVPNDQVWRAGADKNTIISFTHAVKVEGKDVPAGTYGLHIIPSANKATIILSSNSTSWGSYSYDKSEDVLRAEVTPTEAPFQEWLKFEFSDQTANSTVAALVWEKKRIPFKIEVDVHEIVIANIKNELRDVQGFFWQSYQQAANYCLNNDVALEQGLQWADQAVQTQENFNTLSTKATLLAKTGKNDESKSLMDKALNLPSASAGDLYGYGRRLIGRGDKGGALEVFKLNAKKNKDHWLAPHGLARGYSANGDYTKALSFEKKAIGICPARSKSTLEGYAAKLEKGEDFN